MAGDLYEWGDLGGAAGRDRHQRESISRQWTDPPDRSPADADPIAAAEVTSVRTGRQMPRVIRSGCVPANRGRVSAFGKRSCVISVEKSNLSQRRRAA
jgi:hypothetical protein